MGPRNRKSSHGHNNKAKPSKRFDKSGNAIETATKSLQTVIKSANTKSALSEKREYTMNSLIGQWSPSPSTAFKALLSARLCAAVWSNITDCDETYNYWEPSHYLIHGTGFQTWEYSPVYAIRSYAYLWIYTLPAFVYSYLVQANQLLVFYYSRCIFAFCCALCEAYLYRGVTRQFGPSISRLFLFFMILSNGMFISSTAFLPNSFSMYMTALAFGAWLQQHYKIVILTTAISTLIGWPFAALLGVPIAIEMLINKKKRLFFAKWSAIIGCSVALPLILIDTYYYGKLVIAPLNIVLYNVFSSHGPNLYGIEPWTFYFINCFLNFNLVFVVSLTALPIMAFCKFLVKSKRNIANSGHLICVSSLILWFAVFFIQPHKEERFMYPVYPLICLCAAFSIEMVQKALSSVIPKLVFFYSYLVLIFLIVFAFLSISRGLALYKGYHAPMDIYMELGRLNHEHNITLLNRPVNVCVGKEWHRYPSSFFLPTPKVWKLQFIESEFRGQLPKPYPEEPGATRVIPSHMNDLNREEPSRYVNVSECHFLIDTDSDEILPRESQFARDTDNWQIIQSYPFLDARNSPTLFRAFYVPFITESRCKYVNYNLLKNKRMSIE